jgi:hypothetical protein
MITGTYEYQSDFAKKYVAEGEAKAIIEVLTARGIAVPDDARERILSCTDLTRLGTWIRLAVTADSIDALFA